MQRGLQTIPGEEQNSRIQEPLGSEERKHRAPEGSPSDSVTTEFNSQLSVRFPPRQPSSVGENRPGV